jgi:hypothetical protein
VVITTIRILAAIALALLIASTGVAQRNERS